MFFDWSFSICSSDISLCGTVNIQSVCFYHLNYCIDYLTDILAEIVGETAAAIFRIELYCIMPVKRNPQLCRSMYSERVLANQSTNAKP